MATVTIKIADTPEGKVDFEIDFCDVPFDPDANRSKAQRFADMLIMLTTKQPFVSVLSNYTEFDDGSKQESRPMANELEIEDKSQVFANEWLSRVGIDAAKWTDEFLKVAPDAKDWGTMLGWFAYAIMAGYDEGAKHEREKSPQADSNRELSDEEIQKSAEALAFLARRLIDQAARIAELEAANAQLKETVAQLKDESEGEK